MRYEIERRGGRLIETWYEIDTTPITLKGRHRIKRLIKSLGNKCSSGQTTYIPNPFYYKEKP